MNFFTISGLIIALSSTALGLIMIFKSKKFIHYLWVVFCLTVVVWGAGVFMIGSSSEVVQSIYFWRFAYVGVIFIPTIFTHFLYIFLELKKRIFLYFIYLISILFLIFDLFTSYFINNVFFVFDEFYYLGSPTLLYNLFVFFFFVLVIFDFIILYFAHKKEQGQRKNQIRYYLATIPICFGGGFFAFLPVYNILIYPYLNILIAVFPFVIAYAIFKHNLMDIKLIIQRSLVYSILLMFIIVFYLLLISLLGLFFEQQNKINILSAAVFVIIIGIFGVPILKKFFIKQSDRFFFKDKYDYSTTILKLSEVINKNLELDDLLIKLCSKLRKIMKTSLVIITLPDKNISYDSEGVIKSPRQDLTNNIIKVIKNKQKIIIRKEDFIEVIDKKQKNQFDEEQIELIKKCQKVIFKYGLEIFTAIFVEDKLVGLISLSKKLSGDSFNGEDIKLLKTVSIQAGVAIEKAKLYQKVKEYSENLEKKVKSRTAKIVGLQEEQKLMMQEMAHGLQTPLTILKGELAQIRENLGEDKKILSIEHSINRVSRFIYDMLRLSKMESEGKDFKKEEFSLSELMLELIEGFEIITNEKNIKIKHLIQPGVIFIGDRHLIEELISNLVSNSVKYLREDNEKIIKIKLSKKNEQIKITIADNGIGISKENIPKLFSRFRRIENNKKNSHGTGLGLVICKEIVKKHSGRIKIKSEFKKRTTVIIEFE